MSYVVLRFTKYSENKKREMFLNQNFSFFNKPLIFYGNVFFNVQKWAQKSFWTFKCEGVWIQIFSNLNPWNYNFQNFSVANPKRNISFQDEYFRYATQKVIATNISILFCSGLLLYCSTTSTLPPAVYFFSFFLFFTLYGATLMWFDLQYDMTTIF